MFWEISLAIVFGTGTARKDISGRYERLCACAIVQS